MFRPLSGVRVIDLSHVLAGPYCTYILSMMGADVIKIEPPRQGEWARGAGSDARLNERRMGLTFLTQNAGKRSVTINLKDPRGADIVRRLGARAEIVVENMRPGVAHRLGLGYGALSALNKRLVYCSVSGFGQGGPLSQRPAYDHVIQGISGLMSVNGEIDGDPVKIGAPMLDYATGINAALGIVAALHEVRRTERGCYIDVSMLDSTLVLLSSLIVEYVNAGVKPRRIGNDAPSGVTTAGAFQTADGLLLIAANSDTHFAPLMQTIGRSDLLADARFATARDRQMHRVELREQISKALSIRGAAEWEVLLEAAGVPAARPRTIPEIVEDRHIEQRGLLRWIPGGSACETLGVTALGFQIDGVTPGPKAPPPVLGDSTDVVLREAGFQDHEIAALRADGVV